MIIMMMMNYFWGIVDRQKALSLIYSRDHCQRFLPSQISDTTPADFKPWLILSSDFESSLHHDIRKDHLRRTKLHRTNMAPLGICSISNRGNTSNTSNSKKKENCSILKDEFSERLKETSSTFLGLKWISHILA